MARLPVSDEIWNHDPIVVGLRERLGDRLENGTGAVNSGFLKANATDSEYHQGFSLRVMRRDKRAEPISIFAIRDGKHLMVPPRARLEQMLPGHQEAVNRYMELCVSWGCNPDAGPNSSGSWPNLGEMGWQITDRIDELVQCALALASDPPETPQQS